MTRYWTLIQMFLGSVARMGAYPSFSLIYRTGRVNNAIEFKFYIPPMLCINPATVKILLPQMERTKRLMTEHSMEKVRRAPATANRMTQAFHACGKNSSSAMNDTTNVAQLSFTLAIRKSSWSLVHLLNMPRVGRKVSDSLYSSVALISFMAVSRGVPIIQWGEITAATVAKVTVTLRSVQLKDRHVTMT